MNDFLTHKRSELLFLDTEFTGLHQGTTLISIGIVTQNGSSFYAELTDYAQEQVDRWIKENVIKNLTLSEFPAFYFEIKTDRHWRVKGNRDWVREKLSIFLSQFDSVIFWLDHLAYDWVLFCQLFGNALKIPEQVYYIPFDLATFFQIRGIDPDIKRATYIAKELSNGQLSLNRHNALFDAHIIRLCYEKLINTE